MREIKFRLWNETSGACGYTDEGLKLTFPNVTNRKGLIVEQYTGVKDRNGRGIYEGDLLKYGGNWGNVGKVVFDGKFGYSLEYKVSDNHVVRQRQESFADIQLQTEVVGNIHENPEILEVSE